jgi:hypothetical protein
VSEFDVACLGGPASGAYFTGHQLAWLPQRIRVAVRADGGPSLLDLPDDKLEPGERETFYVLQSVGVVCGRRGRGCCRVASYVPEGVDLQRSRGFARQLAVAAGVTPDLRAVR